MSSANDNIIQGVQAGSHDGAFTLPRPSQQLFDDAEAEAMDTQSWRVAQLLSTIRPYLTLLERMDAVVAATGVTFESERIRVGYAYVIVRLMNTNIARDDTDVLPPPPALPPLPHPSPAHTAFIVFFFRYSSIQPLQAGAQGGAAYNTVQNTLPFVLELLANTRDDPRFSRKLSKKRFLLVEQMRSGSAIAGRMSIACWSTRCGRMPFRRSSGPFDWSSLPTTAW